MVKKQLFYHVGWLNCCFPCTLLMVNILLLLGVYYICAHSSPRQELLTLNELEEKDETLLKKATKSPRLTPTP